MNKSPTKLKTLPRPLFSCGIFRNCTQSVLSPTTPPSHDLLPPPPPLPPPNPPLQQQKPQPSSSSSSSSSTSPSFTQWRFPLTHEPCSVNSSANLNHGSSSTSKNGNYGEIEEQFKAGAKIAALRALEKSVTASDTCPMQVMVEVVNALRDPLLARSAAKVLLAMVLVEANRRTAVKAEAVGAAVEAVVASSSSGGGGGGKGTSAAERALAALELMCTVEEGLAEARRHALAAPAMASAVESMEGRGKECAIGVLSAVYGGDQAKDAPDEVVRAVMVAMQGECSARGRRKGAVLLRALQQCGRLDLDLNFEG